MLRTKRRNLQRIDWDAIKVEIIPVDGTNSYNPYAELTPEERLSRLQELYAEIYERRLTRLVKEDE